MSRDLADAKSLLFLTIKINGGMIMYKWKVVVTAVTFAKADPEPLQRLQAKSFAPAPV